MNSIDDLSKSEQEELDRKLKILWTYSSNAIDGSTATLVETTHIIENELSNDKSPQDQYKNSQRLLDEIKGSR